MELVNTEYDKRYLFFGIFDHISISSNNRGVSEQVVLRDITDENGNKIAKYVSFNHTKTFSSLHLVSGDYVSFYARVLKYQDAYSNMYNNYYPNIYFRLFYPTKARKLIKPVQFKSTKFKVHINAIKR